MATPKPTPATDADIQEGFYKKAFDILGPDNWGRTQWDHLNPLQKQYLLEALGILASESSLRGLDKAQDVYSQKKRGKKISPSTWRKSWDAVSAADKIEGS